MEMEVKVEVDEQEVINSLDVGEIFKMSGIDGGMCKDCFGDDLLNEFTLQEIINYFGDSNLLDEIGESRVVAYFGIEVAG